MDGKKITIEELTKRRYARDREPPFNATGSVRATLSQLMRKVDHNLETFRIRKGRRMGPISSEVWVEKRGR
jgi:hypothetical protein